MPLKNLQRTVLDGYNCAGYLDVSPYVLRALNEGEAGHHDARRYIGHYHHILSGEPAHAYTCAQSPPSQPTRLLTLMQVGRNAEVHQSSPADKAQRNWRCLPVSNNTSCWKEEEGRQHPHDDDQGYEHAALTSKPLYELHRCHIVEPCCRA